MSSRELRVDAQVHVWPATFALPGHRRIEPAALVGEMDAAGVDRAILVPPITPDDSNDYVLEVASQYPSRFCVMGRIPLGEAGPGRFQAFTSDPRLVGIRLTFHTDAYREALLRGDAEWLWQAAAAHDVPIAVYAPGLAEEIADVARSHPRLRLALDHLNLGLEETAATLDDALEATLALSVHENISIKAMGLQKYFAEGYPFPNLQPLLIRVIEAFGSQRVFWGSDLTHLACGYREALRLFTHELPIGTATERAAIVGQSLLHWVKWSG